MDMDEKFTVKHIEGVADADVSELQLEIEKITHLSEDEFKLEEKALLRKVRPLSCCPFFSQY